jgi:hypothetical protein
VWQRKELVSIAARAGSARDEKLQAAPTPGGNADRYQTKGVAGKAICKTMKTKGRQTGIFC